MFNITEYDLHTFVSRIVDAVKNGFHISDDVKNAAQKIGDLHVVTLVKDEAEKAATAVEAEVKTVEQEAAPVINHVEAEAVKVEDAVVDEAHKVEGSIEAEVKNLEAELAHVEEELKAKAQ